VVRRALAIAVVAVLAAPAVASAHATLESTSPERGARVERVPDRVVFRFSEPVETAFGAVRVFDARGERVDDGEVEREDGRSDTAAVGLRGGLPEGAYTATYRVISADSHPVAGGFVYTVGEGGAAPAASVDDLIGSAEAGPATDIAFGVTRTLAYLAIALAAGGLAFAAAVWRPARADSATAPSSPAATTHTAAAPGGAAAGTETATATDPAAAAFARRARALGLAAVALGITTSAAGIVLQGAAATGTSFWTALDPGVVEDVLGTRFGTVWGLRLLAWLALGALLAARSRRAVLLAAPLAAFLCVTPALSGHASTIEPGLLIPANAIHVACASIWTGGIAMLLLAVPAATRRLEPAERTRRLAAVVARFSTVALLAVAGLLAAGVLQSIVELDALADLTGTAFGRAILVKAGLVVGVLALGAYNRQRSRRRLAELAATGQSPGRPGVLLRRTLRAEGALLLAVLGVTAALASYSPAAEATGPFSASANLGPARLDLTVDPAEAGSNEVHLYLFRRDDGRAYDRVKELRLRLTLPDKRIGPLPLDAEKAGPGHYVVRRAGISPPGDWRLEIDARVSEFDLHTARLEVPVR
jgi:copper transport protein